MHVHICIYICIYIYILTYIHIQAIATLKGARGIISAAEEEHAAGLNLSPGQVCVCMSVCTRTHTHTLIDIHRIPRVCHYVALCLRLGLKGLRA